MSYDVCRSGDEPGCEASVCLGLKIEFEGGIEGGGRGGWMGGRGWMFLEAGVASEVELCW